MGFDVKNWFSQVTTGGGIAGLLATATAYFSHSITWEVALVGLIPSLYLLVHPEDNKGAADVKQVTSDVVAAAPVIEADVNTLLNVFKAGMTHAATLNTPAPSAPAAPVTTN